MLGLTGQSAKSAQYMLLCAFLATNLSRLTSGSYGVLVPTIERVTGASRVLSTTGLPLAILTMCALAPFMGGLIQRVPLRGIMLTGAGLCITGFLALSLVDNIVAILAIYAIFLGPGMLMMGTLSASTLVNSWFTQARGKAIALANLPLIMFVVPLATSGALHQWGLRGAFLMLAAATALLVPLLLRVKINPELHAPAGPAASAAGSALLTPRDFLGRADFWLICTGAGFMQGGGPVLLSHLVPLGLERGLPMTEATSLVSAFGAGLLFGGIGCGWLADRFGASKTFVGIAVFQAVLWTVFAPLSTFYPMLTLSALMGLGNGGVLIVYCAALTETFGPRNFSRVLGFSAVITTIFLFAAAPLVGLLYVSTGSYELPLLLQAGAFGVAAVFMLLQMARHSASKRRARTDAAQGLAVGTEIIPEVP